MFLGQVFAFREVTAIKEICYKYASLHSLSTRRMVFNGVKINFWRFLRGQKNQHSEKKNILCLFVISALIFQQLSLLSFLVFSITTTTSMIRGETCWSVSDVIIRVNKKCVGKDCGVETERDESVNFSFSFIYLFVFLFTFLIFICLVRFFVFSSVFRYSFIHLLIHLYIYLLIFHR